MKTHKDPSPPLDLVTLVNEHDEVIGEMDKIEAHRGQGKRHRAISVYLFRNLTTQQPNNLTTQLLIQQRSAKKIVGAHQWANTVCGNVRPNETYEQCAYRRLKEELGISFFSALLEGRTSSETLAEPDKRSGSNRKPVLTPIHKFEYHLACNEEFSEWEIDQVFVGWYDGEVAPDPDEVQDFAWVDFNNLKLKAHNAKLEIQDFNTKRISFTTHSSQLKPENQNLKPSVTLAPWFVYMLEDEELQERLKQFAGI